MMKLWSFKKTQYYKWIYTFKKAETFLLFQTFNITSSLHNCFMFAYLCKLRIKNKHFQMTWNASVIRNLGLIFISEFWLKDIYLTAVNINSVAYYQEKNHVTYKTKLDKIECISNFCKLWLVMTSTFFLVFIAFIFAFRNVAIK